MNTQSVVTSAPGGLRALDLANAYLADSGVRNEEDLESQRMTILEAADVVHESPGPLAWTSFEPPVYFRRLDFLPEIEQVQAGITLVGFFGWLAFGGDIPVEPTTDILEEIADAAPENPVLRAFCDHAVSLLTRAEQ